MTPRLSLVLPIEHASMATALLDAVRDDRIWADLELVLVCPVRADARLAEDEVAGVGAVQVVETGSFESLGLARAAGIRAARAELVFVAETHAFPARGCLDTLVQAHAGGDYAAVAPIFQSANPGSAHGWASLFLTYRYMLEPLDAQVTVPGYNTCFRREALLAFGPELAAALGSGSRMGELLLARGERVRREPAARILHLNVARPASVVLDRVLATREWAATRAEGWSRGKRLLALAASPLIPPLLVARTVRSRQWARVRDELPRGTFAALCFSALCVGLGEALAYAFGSGGTQRRVIRIELERERHV